MAQVTGGEEQMYSRRGPASRYYQGAPQDFLRNLMQQAQGMATAAGLGGQADPRITGDYSPAGTNVTTGGGGGSGEGSRRVTTGAGGSPRGPQVSQQSGALFPRSGLLGGTLAITPSVLGAVQSAQEGRSLEAATTAGVGIPTALGAAALGARVGGLPGAVLAIGGSALAPAIGQAVGGMAEKAKAKLTGEEIAGQPGSTSAQAGQRAKGREEILKDAELQAQIAQQYGGAYLEPTLQAMRDLRQNDVDMMIQSEKRLDPIIRQRLNDAMVRQQTLMNTQGQNYAMLGTIATAGKLATGAQEQAGANLRTALSQNPYAGSVLSAPNISF